MSDPIAGQVSRPESFNPDDDYALVIARGDEWLGDYDVIDAQKIQRQDMAIFSRGLFVEGGVIFETGGTISAAVAGVNLGPDALASAGDYVGIESQVYTVSIVTGGVAGAAEYTWRSTGADQPQVAGEPHTITAIAPDLPTALADLVTYGHKVGVQGLVVVFANSSGSVTGANSWQVDVTYGARPPTVAGNDITIYDVVIPVGGRLHRGRGLTLTYPALGAGISTVYAEWIRKVVTHVENPNLTDPRSDRGQAWRERWRITLRNTDTSGLPLGANEVERRVFPIYAWDRATDEVTRVARKPYAIDINKTQGALDSERLLNVDHNEVLKGLLAHRTSGAHGSFVVSPLPPARRGSISTNAPTVNMIRLNLPPVEASVEGLTVIKPFPTELEVEQATEYASVSDEPHTSTGTDKYKLNKAAGVPAFPIRVITKVTAVVQKGVLGSAGTYEGVLRGGGDNDTLALTPVIAIVRISNTNGGASNYTLATDYTLVGNQVHWLTGGGAIRPTGGATYYVVYKYQKLMVSPGDYTLSGAGEVDFTPAGDNPVDTTVFEVDYDYYLPRTDAIVLRPTGEFLVVKGLPSEKPVLPTLPIYTLPYLQVEVAANTATARLRKFPNDRVTMEMLNRLIAALDELEVNFGLQDLTNQARSKSTANFLDVLAEDFTTLLIADENYNVGGVVFDATVDTEAGELTLPFDQEVRSLAKVAAPGAVTDVQATENFYMLPYTDELAVDQSYWSIGYPVNPYADFRPEPANARIDPEQDFYVDTQFLESSETRTVQNGHHENRDIVGQFTTVETQVTEVTAVYMRQIEIRLSGEDFVPTEKIRLKFDGKNVELTATAPTAQGANAFTIIARPSEMLGPDVVRVRGDFRATFDVPPNVPVGIVPVEVYGDMGMVGSVWPADYAVRARLAYTSDGLLRLVSVNTITTLIQNDPIAQSFIFPEARMVTKVDVPLQRKPIDSGKPLIFEIRATDRAGRASSPIDQVLGRKRVEPHDLNIGPASSNPVTFGDPVYFFPNEFRSLVLRSGSNQYRAFVATVGAVNKAVGGFVEKQAYVGGIFMDSSNNADWTPWQKTDLRSKVYVAKMSPLTAHLYLARVSTFANLTGFFFNPDQVIPDGTSIEWQYSVDGIALGVGGKVWTTFVPFTLVELAAVTSTLDIRGILRSTNDYVSPSVHKDNISIQLQRNINTLTYVSIEKELTANATVIQGGFETIVPAGGTQVVKVSLDNGAAFTTLNPVTDINPGQPAENNFTNYTFDVTVGSGKQLRLEVIMTTPNIAQRPRMRKLFAFASPL